MQIPQTEIILTRDGVELARQTVPPGEYLLGRGADVDFRMETPLASRHHARLTVNYDEWLVEDLGSANGTFVNDQLIAPHESLRVFPTQTLRVGDATVTLRRLRGSETPGVSLAPSVAVGRTLLPEEVRAQRYAIGKVVAQGGMGAILSAHDRSLRRGVAMKVMLGSGDTGDLTRFVEEAQITGQLEHPNIVPVHELGVDEQDQFFYTMKFVGGITLRKVLELLAAGEAGMVKKYPLAVLLTIFQKVGDALAFAHSRGVIHRDLKPENIMLGEFGEVLVMDWGLAKILGGSRAAEAADRAPGSAAPSMARPVVHTSRTVEPELGGTMAGTIMGTPQYMSPEQARGEVETLDARSDIYALGTSLFHVLFQRPAFSGANAMEIVEKAGLGAIEWPPARDLRRAPASLLAVCRKALALEPAHRYASVEALQADLLAYQNGFATGAEKAGTWKQIKLLVKRHKATSIGIAAVFLVGLTLGTKAVVEGRRAERGEAQARQALADLKKQAPALREMAESEAGFQRFDSALQKLDAAIGLDPDYLPSYWRRAWLFIGMDRLREAAAALRLAEQKDHSHAELAKIRPTVESLAALPNGEEWPVEPAHRLYSFLANAGAAGEVGALSGKLRLNAQARAKLINSRLDQWLGKDKPRLEILPSGAISLSGFPKDLSTLEPLHGLPINSLNLDHHPISSLEPLRGMPLDELHLGNTTVANLEPLRGMRLTYLDLDHTKVIDLSPLQGMPLRTIQVGGTAISDLSPLRGAPLESFSSGGSRVVDCSPLQDAPLRWVSLMSSGSNLQFLAKAPVEDLSTWMGGFRDLSPLRGRPLRHLNIRRNNVTDLSPLQGTPIEWLEINDNPIRDLSPLLGLLKLERLRVSKPGKLLAPLRAHPSLKFISLDDDPYRPVAEFWAEYDAEKPERERQARLEEAQAKSLISKGFKQLPDGSIEVRCSSNALTLLPQIDWANVKEVILQGTNVRDLAPLRGLPLRLLLVNRSPVTSLEPIRGMPLRKIHFGNTPITDVTPLLDCPTLEQVILPQGLKNIEPLKKLPKLRYIGYTEGPGPDYLPDHTAAEFWKEYDAQQAAVNK